MRREGVFLDRDDTIIKDMVYLDDPDKIHILPKVCDAVTTLNQRNIPVIVITNQSGIARGILDEERLAQIHLRMLSLLARHNARIDAIYYCPHHPEGTVPQYSHACSCRKPEPGLLIQAARDFSLDLESCYMIGDKPIDVETIHRVGGKGVLLAGDQYQDDMQQPEYIAHDILDAVHWILKDIN